MSQLDLLGAPSSDSFPKPRPFQDTAHRELRAGFSGGHKRQIVMAPTGAGKTFLALRVCNEALARGKRALFICDRKTLINQTSAVADGYGMPTHGIIQADNPRMALWRPFQIASAQTIGARGLNDDFDVVVVDEAHTIYEPVTEFILNTKAAVIGLSATPFTKGLGKLYSRVINAATMDELVRQGILTPLRVLSCKRPDMEGAKTSGGEWTQKAAAERGMGIVGDVVAEWHKHAFGLKTIVFGSTIAHCEEIARQFATSGVRAAVFTANTPDTERRVLLEEYRQPDAGLRVLVSVEALAKGFDVPDVGCVCDCRPLRKSLSTFVQMIGRGLRSFPGKTECILLDFSGNVIRFADDFSGVYFNGLGDLDQGEKKDAEVRKDEDHPAKECPACGYSPCGKRCVRCGFERVTKSLVEHEAGEAEEVNILGTSPTAYATSKAELYAMIATHERGKWERRGKTGNPKGATAHRYKEITGKWPAEGPKTLDQKTGKWLSAFDYETAPHTTPSRALQGKLRSMEIAWAKAMAKRGRR